MKIINCEQNTPEWFAARMGKPTASRFDDIITAGGKKSASDEKYINHILGELLLGEPVAEFEGNANTQRGKDLEDEAFSTYQFQTEYVCKRVGFVTNDAGTIGCSPDLLVGEDGLGELKCPKLHVFMEYLYDNQELVKNYKVQVQGQLYVTGRKWVDLIAYYPALPLIIVRVQRDEQYLTLMSGYLATFLGKLTDKRQKLIDMGYMGADAINPNYGKEILAG